jgi:hypothetical protein
MGRADDLGWWPGKPELFTWRGRILLNTWRPPPPLPPEGPEPTIWLEHLAWLIPEKERRHVLDVLAYNVQHLDGKVNHAIVLYGQIRTGKDLLLQPVRKWMGAAWHDVKSEELSRTFNYYLSGAKVLCVQEAKLPSFEEGMALYNKFKTIIAAPPDELMVEEKFLHPFAVPNLVQVVFTTNYPNGLYFEEREDARYFVISSPVSPQPPAYYRHLAEYIEQHYLDVVSWLARRKLSAFNPKAPPPSTKGREEMHAATRSSGDVALVEIAQRLISAGQDPQLVFTVGDIRLRGGDRPRLIQMLDSPGRARVGKVLRDAGYENAEKKIEGMMRTIYWERGSMTPGDAADWYRRFLKAHPAHQR